MPSETNSAKTSVSTLRLTFILAALTAFAPLSTDMYLASFSSLAATFATDEGRVQLSLSVFFFGLSVGQLIYGPLIDRFGRKPPLIVGLVVFTLASVAIVVVPTVDGFIALRLFQALGGCAGMVVSRAVVSDLFDERGTARFLSQMMLVQGLAPILAPLLGGYILAVAPWEGIFAVLALFGAGCIVAAARGLPETLPPERRQAAGLAGIGRAFGKVLADRAFMAPTLAGAFAAASLFAFISGSPFVYMQLHGVSQQHYGWLFGFNAFGMILASQFNRLLLRWLSTRTVMVGALLFNMTMAVVLVVFAAQASLPVLVGLLWLCLATGPLIGANAMAIAMSRAGDHRGTASSVMGVTQFAVAGLASAAVGLLHDGTVYPMVGIILAGGVLASLAYVTGRHA
ncbi:Bcr/CflA subfamily drug resistance transporter [uncultured Pleomorphomonas sp.]|uniref:Bcr/CflA family efflux transporter n=1 Tax=uncultured Pleomorphomonas sp. TaxID=442121 RepID=A0A212LB45_9HYPH|nr:multidrug effflux MFS transporter [uncultured Pleomorphomonas sp.]SCM74728.1 Bcr/CflA subfamily drug resistance transporter [uncultured Pleomorphomonas sp.]